MLFWNPTVPGSLCETDHVGNNTIYLIISILPKDLSNVPEVMFLQLSDNSHYWLTMSSISELIPFSSSLFFLWNCSLVSSCWFLSEEKPTSFYSTVSRVTEDCMSFLTSMTPPKWFCILYSSAISETLGCTPWMDTLNRLNALHLNATLLPRIVMSYVGKSCAACSLSNLTSMNLLHRDIILCVVVNLTVPNSGEHLHICIKFFQLALSIKNIL